MGAALFSPHSIGQSGSWSRCNPGRGSRARRVLGRASVTAQMAWGPSGPPPDCWCHKPSHPPRTFLGLSWATAPGSWSCLLKKPLEIQLLSGRLGAPAYFLPSSADVSSLFRPPQTSGVCLEGHTGACRAVTSGGNSGEEACPSLTTRWFSAFFK